MVANEIAAFRPPRYSAVNAEPVYVDVCAEEGLNNADEQDDHVVPSLEEPHAQSPDDEGRNESEQDESAQVVPVGNVGPPNSARCEVVAQEAANQKSQPEPGAALISQASCSSTAARLDRSVLWLRLRRLGVRRCGSDAAVWCDWVRSLRLLGREVGDVAFAFVFHWILRFSTSFIQSRLTSTSAMNRG